MTEPNSPDNEYVRGFLDGQRERQPEVEWLTAERDHARRTSATFERTMLAAVSTLDRMRPVVEAAVAWRNTPVERWSVAPEDDRALVVAVDAYTAGQVEVPPTPTTDAEIEALPRVDLAAFRPGEPAAELLDAAETLRDEVLRVSAERDQYVAESRRLGDFANAKVQELKELRGRRAVSVIFGHHKNAPRPFALFRQSDVTGVSGTGIVAEGAAFSDGTAVLRWLSEWPTSVVFHKRGIEAIEAIHGHGGATEIVWLSDELPSLAEMETERDDARATIERVKALMDGWNATTGKDPWAQIFLDAVVVALREVLTDATADAAQQAAGGRTGAAEGEETHQAAPDAPRSAEGLRVCGPCSRGNHMACDWDEETPPYRCACNCMPDAEDGTEDLRTPDEWLAAIRPGWQVMDPDGWRGKGGRPWTDRISRTEFLDRLMQCTITGPAKGDADA